MPRSSPPPPEFIAPHIRRGRYLFLDPGRRGPLALVCAGWEECSPDFSIDRPSFRWHAIELLEAGAWEVRTGRGWQPAPAGTVVAYGPGHAGAIRATGSGPHGKYFADFHAAPPRHWMALAGMARRRVRSLPDFRRMGDLWEQLIACSDLRGGAQADLADTLLRALLLRLGAEPDTAPRRSTRSRVVFERCRDHLADNYARLSGPGEAARACHVGPEYLSRLFRAHTGRTASQFLARLRMLHAAKLLQGRDMTVKAAAQAVGIPDPYHFSRVFKKIHGVPPRTFKAGAKPRRRDLKGIR